MLSVPSSTGGHGRWEVTEGRGRPREATGGPLKPRETTEASSRAQIFWPGPRNTVL